MLIALMLTGCVEEIIKILTPIHSVYPVTPVNKVWDNYDVQWTIVLNNKVYLHQMRKRVNANGVECQFVLIEERD